MKELIYTASMLTDAGGRPNEDAGICLQHKDENSLLLFCCVADGVGGLEHGDIASHFVINCLEQWFEEEKNKIMKSDPKEATNLLYDKVMNIHSALMRVNEEKEMNAGTTLTAALLFKKEYLILQVGDSRAYLFDEENGCRQITKDQTQAQLARDRGGSENMITPAMEKTILQCVGMNRIRPEIYSGKLPLQYQLLVCSDGLSNRISAEDFLSVMSGTENGKAKLSTLIDMARNRGEKDNITGIIAGRKETARCKTC